MNTNEPEKRGPGRPPKQRRRKSSHAQMTGQRLAVNESMLDKANYKYRWINDSPARIMMKTKEDDWDIVTNAGGVVKDDSTDLGNAVSAVVGSHQDGSPMRAYLCRKPKSYWDEDQSAKGAELDEQLAQLRRGMTRAGASQSDYVPNSGIRI